MQQLGRVLGNVFAVVLTVFSLQAMAADASLAGRDFNHMTTGFPLTGGHDATCVFVHNNKSWSLETSRLCVRLFTFTAPKKS